MKSKWLLVLSGFQLAIGILAVISFVILALAGEKMSKWIGALLLAIAFVVLGIKGIAGYKSSE